MRFRTLLFVLAPLAALSCGAFISAFQKKAEGPNPIGGQPLVLESNISHEDGLADCRPNLRPKDNTTLSASDEEICLAETIYVFRGSKRPLPTTGRAKVTSDEFLEVLVLDVDGKKTDRITMTEKEKPEIVMECESLRNDPWPYLYLWKVETRGCTANHGQLVAESQKVDVYRDGASKPYMVFSFTR